MEEKAILQLQAQYKKIFPFFSELPADVTRPIETRYRTVISRFKKADIASRGREWQDILITLNNPLNLNNQGGQQKYNEKLFLLNDFLQMTYAEAISSTLSSEERERQIEFLEKFFKIILKPKNATLKQVIESFSDINPNFKRSKHIQQIQLSVIEIIRSEQQRINRTRAYNNYSAFKETRPVKEMQMQAPPPELIAYLKAIGEACIEGVQFNPTHPNTSNVKEIIGHFGEKFVVMYIKPKFVKQFFQVSS